MASPEPSNPAPGGSWVTRTSNSVKYPSNSSSAETVFLTIEIIELPDVTYQLIYIELWGLEVDKTPVKFVLSGRSKIDKTKILMVNGSLMKVESIAECSRWSILQYFWPALSDNRSWKSNFSSSFWVAA